VSATKALKWISLWSGLRVPEDPESLRSRGLAPDALGAEVDRARSRGVSTLLAGIELVEIAGTTHLGRQQITEDLRAFRTAGADGLVLSWDLWHVPREWLELVGDVWVQ
jgi:hypothetical protein